MQKSSEKILQEKIIKKLENLNLDSSDFEFAKAEIIKITNKKTLIVLDENLEEQKDNIINGHFLTNFNGLITQIRQQIEGIIDNDTKKIQTHNSVICENRKEVMEHELVVKAIKGFYGEKLNGNFNEVKKLSQEELKIEKEKYQDTYSWALYSRQINFVLENIEDFFIYLFQNNFWDKVKEKHLFEEKNLIFQILSDISLKDQENKNYKEILRKNTKLKVYDDLNHQVLFYNSNLKNLSDFLKTINLKQFFGIIDYKELIKAFGIKNFFESVNIKDFFESVSIKDFFNELNIKIRRDSSYNDLIITINDKYYGDHKILYLGKKGLYTENFNSDQKYLIDFKGNDFTGIKKININNFPKNEQLILIYDGYDGGFTDIYK